MHIEIRRLKLNPHNDRHGSLRDEAAAIQWLLENRSTHMKALAKDLAEAKRLYERPLVRQEGEVFVVFDGNRRTCCIKLLSDPSLAPSEEWTHFFANLKSKELDSAYAKIECEVEQDLSIIDETLYRRHTGSQDGVGQSQWDPAGKARAIIRKFESDKPIVSAHSMQQYVHNPNFHPAQSDLRSIWNVIRPLIANSLR